MLEGYFNSVNVVAFLPDSQLVVSASHDRTVWLWETAIGSCYSMLEGHSNSVNAVFFLPDGQYL